MRVAAAGVLGLAWLTTGCATVLSHKTGQFHFNSTPDHAQVVVDGDPVGITPLTIDLSNTQSHSIVFKKQGYQDMGCLINKSTGKGWVLLDVVTGVFPVAIDAATNNWAHDRVHECTKTLEPMTASR